MDWRRELMGGLSSGIDINNYLTIEALEDGLTASLNDNDCEYCIDGNDNWKSLTAGTATKSINAGHTLSFRGNLTPNITTGIGTFTISKKCNLLGNCMSILFGDNVADNYSLSGKNYAFYKLFYNCANIVNVSENFLPATILARSCYENMFCNCTSLTTAPSLPSMSLSQWCYVSMFAYCKSLIMAPKLPAISLSIGCYISMFTNCLSLITAPELPATVLTYQCYQDMFNYCKKLNYIKMLATDISISYCLSNWVSNVASTGTFIKNPAMTTLPTGSSGIPEGWTVVDDGEESGESSLTFPITLVKGDNGQLGIDFFNYVRTNESVDFEEDQVLVEGYSVANAWYVPEIVTFTFYTEIPNLLVSNMSDDGSIIFATD